MPMTEPPRERGQLRSRVLRPLAIHDASGDRPRSQDEDVDQFPRTLLPTGTGSYTGDAHQGPEQVDGIEIFPDVAALDGALHQTAHRFVNLTVRSLAVWYTAFSSSSREGKWR